MSTEIRELEAQLAAVDAAIAKDPDNEEWRKLRRAASTTHLTPTDVLDLNLNREIAVRKKKTRVPCGTGASRRTGHGF